MEAVDCPEAYLKLKRPYISGDAKRGCLHGAGIRMIVSGIGQNRQSSTELQMRVVERDSGL